MKPTRIWLGLLLLALGVFGILEATGTLAWNDTVGQWWPVAIIAFGLANMATERRITFGQAVITAIGLALLADQQDWASDILVWSLLLGGIGLAVLFGRGRSHKPDHQGADREASQVGSHQDHGPR
jgi:divalent metal cation (Fe/Co/Zn/Cd) transporter